MDDYIKTIVNGIKSWVDATVKRLERSVARVDSLLDAKVETINPVLEGSFSQNRKAGTNVGSNSHAEGSNTTASGDCSHAEGYNTTARAYCSHAEGYNTTASGTYSHAEGFGTTASGDYSHAEGFGTTASGYNSHAQGTWNIQDTEKKYAHIVGNGSILRCSNAHTLDWEGVAWFQGRPQFGGTAQDDGSQTVMANGDTEISLKSPAGKSYKITVSDDGTITTTEVTA